MSLTVCCVLVLSFSRTYVIPFTRCLYVDDSEFLYCYVSGVSYSRYRRTAIGRPTSNASGENDFRHCILNLFCFVSDFSTSDRELKAATWPHHNLLPVANGKNFQLKLEVFQGCPFWK